MSAEDWIAVGTLVLALATAFLAMASYITAKRTKDLVVETTALGGYTEDLAHRTRVLAEETQRLANFQQSTLRAGAKPTLTSARVGGVSFDDAAIKLDVRNVGAGLAIGQKPRLIRWDDPNDPNSAESLYGVLSDHMVPAGEMTTAVFDFAYGNESLRRDLAAKFERFRSGSLGVLLTYTDEFGGQEETAQFTVDRDEDEQWSVKQIDLQRTGEDAPYASSRRGGLVSYDRGG
jgi:hypothetical protein